MDASTPDHLKRATPQGRPLAPFDHALSQQVDILILQLDARPRGLRRAWLRFKKSRLERRILSLSMEAR